ncbi:putative HTH-type transcriptional regulator yxaF, partial [Lacticaseibacillus paracasei subsp. paracasei Lpp229]
MDTREKLVATAASLFQKEGVRATGLAQILTVSGTPKGSLYYYFQTVKRN